MAGNIEVDPELLRQAAAKTASVTDSIRAVLTKLESAIDGKGQPWGDDIYGTRFAEGEGGNGYTAARDNLAKLTDDTVSNSDEQSAGQYDSAKLQNGTEQASADTFK